MKKVFLIESDQLQAHAWESLLKGSEWSLYTLYELEDFSFRCSDFGPDIVVIGEALATEESLKQIQEVVADIPLFVLAFENKPIFGELPLMLKPFEVSRLREILNELHAKSQQL